jgi:protein-S-isoprenylcysteine O-methyltransferase Ste14
MEHELWFRIILAAILVSGFAISGYHRRRAAARDSSVSSRDENVRLRLLRAAIGLPTFTVLAGHLITPEHFEWASFGAPDAIRWLGVVVSAATLPLLGWLFRHLGHNVTTTTLVKETHSFVQTGPYRWVRHPLYSTGVLTLTGFGLALGNFVILGMATIFVIAWLTIVIPREEAELIGRFGEPYQDYRRRTGALIPRCVR